MLQVNNKMADFSREQSLLSISLYSDHSFHWVCLPSKQMKNMFTCELFKKTLFILTTYKMYRVCALYMHLKTLHYVLNLCLPSWLKKRDKINNLYKPT